MGSHAEFVVGVLFLLLAAYMLVKKRTRRWKTPEVLFVVCLGAAHVSIALNLRIWAGLIYFLAAILALFFNGFGTQDNLSKIPDEAEERRQTSK